MHIKTVLNKIYKFKRFVFKKCRFDKNGRLIITIVPRKNSKAVCGDCRSEGPVYDSLEKRLFEFIPIWNIPVFFKYTKRRIFCSNCKRVVTEYVPWCDGKNRQTLPYRAFLASWAEEIPWKSVAERFNTSWQSVCRAVEWVVEYGLKHRNLSGVTALGVDEIQYKKGHKYLTLVYQIDIHCRRLLWVGETRTKKCFEQFFDEMESLQEGFCVNIKFVCSDMWKSYLKIIRKRLKNAMHVLDRFHIRKKFSEAIDKMRRQETARLKKEGYDPVLSRSRWCFLKKRSNLTGKQKSRLKDLLTMNLRTVKVYLLTEEFEHFWTYKSPAWAKKFLEKWTRKVMYSKLKPMKDVAKTLRRHEELILNWFRAKKKISNGITEGLNNNAKIAFRNARGYKSFRVAEIALLHKLGKLPKPTFKHQFY
jgi:transposase